MKKSGSSHILRTILAQNLRHIRSAKGWSQEDLADAVGLHRTYIGSIERGERNLGIDNVERLANVLQIPVTNLLTKP
ncbi:MAG: helix-turn-helix transcriptional regulator [Acetobacter sp.]|jgi:transcriptional regulator with XRE-family HTH domain|uniref:helix-turn-helix domain-containing protein n=1 Tax=Acetobacter TaxID=434 RepID=UPI00209DAB14|nr:MULTISPECIES: helix-turn-helix transcriptional regulator [Acetobacter]MCP1227766.1 helix-turn-helix transcriptional regulator [Acetobacter fabarum]MCP1234737.1 helix-turn-helix transcriptional regulator [Acetobacter fabarum]MCP1239171.1 helix-turn-helix transcriptional regulator [Acetobacter lovaniensis]